jgi:DNA (cytosine-5)-methyltransferase 1
LKSLDCFAGIGGFALGMSWAGIETIGFVEADEKAQLVLKKNFPGVPIHGDIRTFDGSQYKGKVSIVSGGFPCQPWSGAGRKRGHLDDRDLWDQMLGTLRTVQPKYFLGENVQGFVNKEMGLQRATTDLEKEGFQTRNFLLPACGVNAPHQRYRIFIVGYSKHNGSSSPEECGDIVEAGKRGEEEQKQTVQSKRTGGRGCDEDVAYSKCYTEGTALWEKAQRFANRKQNNRDKIRNDSGDSGESSGIEGRERSARVQLCGSFDGVSPKLDGSISAWSEGWEDGIPRVEVGVKNRSTRLKQLGNSVLPQLVYMIADSIVKADQDL